METNNNSKLPRWIEESIERRNQELFLPRKPKEGPIDGSPMKIEIPHGIENLYTAGQYVERTKPTAEQSTFELTLHSGEAEWLKGRRGHIGASQAGTVLGLTDAWKTRRQLWEELTGRATDTFAGNEFTRRGQQEEPMIRALWAIEHPGFDVYDGTHLQFVSRAEPWRSCTLDMIICERATGRWYVGEVKTGIWHKAWSGGSIPDAYLAQISQQLDITGFDGAILIARLQPTSAELGSTATNREIYYSAEDMRGNMDFVRGEVNDFWQSVQKREYRPKINLE